jgi:hypothetical protein
MLSRGAVMALVLISVACVAPARNTSTYSSKSGQTATTVLSAVNTAHLASDLAGQHRAFVPSTAVTIAGSEESARSAQGTFDSIQPPDPESDQIRAQLDPLLARAVDLITQLRIVARRGELDRLPAIAAPLEGVAASLDRFAEEHP